MTTLNQFLVDYITNTSGVSDALSLSDNEFLNKDIYGVRDFKSHVQFKSGQYQVQVFSTPPFFIIPEHKHPNVDSFEVYISGEIDFSVEGLWLSNKDESEYTFIDDIFVVDVKHDTIHGASFGKNGGRFMSVQKWINSIDPSCVGIDYDGLGVSKKQSEIKNVLYKEDMTLNDAAKKDNVICDFKTRDTRYWNLLKPDITKYQNLPKPEQYFINKL